MINFYVLEFTNGPGDQGSIPGRVITNTQKMVLDATLLSTQHYKVRIKGKVEQSREKSSTFPSIRCSIYLKGALGLPSTKVTNLLLTIMTTCSIFHCILLPFLNSSIIICFLLYDIQQSYLTVLKFQVFIFNTNKSIHNYMVSRNHLKVIIIHSLAGSSMVSNNK